LWTLLNTRDQQLSAQVSRMLGHHSEQMLNSICACQPNMDNQWAINTSGEILAKEGYQALFGEYPNNNLIK